MVRHNSSLYTCVVLAAESSLHHMCVSLNRPLILMLCVLKNILKCLLLNKASCLVMQNSLVFKSWVCSMNVLADLKQDWMLVRSWNFSLELQVLLQNGERLFAWVSHSVKPIGVYLEKATTMYKQLTTDNQQWPHEKCELCLLHLKKRGEVWRLMKRKICQLSERGNKLFLCSDVWEPLNGSKERSISAKKKQPRLFS